MQAFLKMIDNVFIDDYIYWAFGGIGKYQFNGMGF